MRRAKRLADEVAKEIYKRLATLYDEAELSRCEDVLIAYCNTQAALHRLAECYDPTDYNQSVTYQMLSKQALAYSRELCLTPKAHRSNKVEPVALGFEMPD